MMVCMNCGVYDVYLNDLCLTCYEEAWNEQMDAMNEYCSDCEVDVLDESDEGVNIYVSNGGNTPSGFIHAKTYRHFTRLINEYHIHTLIVGYDLNDRRQRNGCDVIRYICESPRDFDWPENVVIESDGIHDNQLMDMAYRLATYSDLYIMKNGEVQPIGTRTA